MDESTFWRIIDNAQAGSGNLENYVYREGMEILQRQLAALEPHEIISFQELFGKKYREAYRWDLWAAAFIIGGGCSDDGFMDFRAELISRGQRVYEAALLDPQSLADAPGPPIEGLEGWLYLAFKAYRSKMGKDFPAPASGKTPHPTKPSGEPWDEDTVNLKYPKLAQKFGS